jgi:pyruvate dehydrogenase E1 component beta subunit
MVHVAAAAAETLAGEGVSAEVIDLRTLYPWDRAAVHASVRKTGRLLVVHEAVQVGGFGGEIVADVSEHLFDRLKGPARRIGGPRIPIPFSVPLEAAYMIPADAIVERVRADLG